MLMSVLFSRGHKKLLSIVTNGNYVFVTNKTIYNCLQNKINEGS